VQLDAVRVPLLNRSKIVHGAQPLTAVFDAPTRRFR